MCHSTMRLPRATCMQTRAVHRLVDTSTRCRARKAMGLLRGAPVVHGILAVKADQGADNLG